MRRLLPLVLVALAVLTAACGDETVDEAADMEDFEAFKERVLSHEEAIADCMHERGFEYVADLPPDVRLEEVATRAEREGADPHEAVESEDLGEDPNMEILNGLSEGEHAAWEVAYWGEESAPEEGCYNATYEAVWGIDPLIIEDESARAAEKVRNDPRVLEAEEDYLDCMGERGYDVADLDEVHRLVEERKADAAEGGEDVSQAWIDEGWAAHDHCREDYAAVRDEVHLEHFSFTEP